MQKIVFIENIRFLLDVREKVSYSFKSNVFPLENSTSEPRPEPTPEPKLNLPVFYTTK